MAKVNGGTKILLGVFATLLLSGVVALASRTANKLDDHKDLPGHPRLEERVDGLAADVAEIKKRTEAIEAIKDGVETLLERSGP